MKWTTEKVKKIEDLIVEGKSYSEIANIFGETRDSIRYVVNKFNINFESIHPKRTVEIGDNKKYCGVCCELKTKDDFNRNKSKKDGLNTICRSCSNIKSKEYYKENTTKHIIDINIRKKKYVNNVRKYVFDYLNDNPCIDCGETNPIVLEFDHRDNVKKDFIISNGIHRGYKIEKIKSEIEKCDVRCSNCHKIRTAKQFGWYSSYFNDLNVKDPVA